MLSLCVGKLWFYEKFLKWLFGLNHKFFSAQQQMNTSKEVTSNLLFK